MDNTSISSCWLHIGQKSCNEHSCRSLSVAPCLRICCINPRNEMAGIWDGCFSPFVPQTHVGVMGTHRPCQAEDYNASETVSNLSETPRLRRGLLASSNLTPGGDIILLPGT